MMFAGLHRCACQRSAGCAPARRSARPAIFLSWIISTTSPHASLACSCPTKPAMHVLRAALLGKQTCTPICSRFDDENRTILLPETARLLMICEKVLSVGTVPAAKGMAVPSSAKPSPLMCVCVATRCFFVVELTSSILMTPLLLFQKSDPGSDPLC